MRVGALGSVFMMNMLPAILVILFFTLIGVASFAALLLFQDLSNWQQVLSSRYIWRLLNFSLWQAFLSSLISLLIAIPVTSALMHRRFWGRDTLLQLFSISLVVPTIVAILGIVVVYGQSGWITRATGVELPLYGLFGILLAHVFFNMPLAVRILIQAHSLIPVGQWRLSYQLGFSRWNLFCWVEWPYLRKALPGAFLLIFMLCFSSFAVVLSLGGGPKSSTLEVAIYQALKFEFDIAKASVLSLLQVFVCSLVAVLVYRFASHYQQDFSLKRLQNYPVKDSVQARCFDIGFLVFALLILLPPFIAILTPVFSPLFIATLEQEATWSALWVTIKIAVPSAAMSLGIAMAFVVVSRACMDRRGFAWLPSKLEYLGGIILILPSLVMATGLFLLLRNLGIAAFDLAYWVVVWVNAIMALPFVLRVVFPTFYQQEKRYRTLYQSLGIHGLARFRLEWPMVRQSVAQATAYALLLSLGDMSVIALFGSQGLTSLPLYLFQLIGSYRIEQGACIAVLLVIVCFALFSACNRVIGGKSNA